MSETPLSPDATESYPPQVSKSKASWFHRLSSVLFIIFCFELGLFLLIYPWIPAWSDNFFAWAVPHAMQKGWNMAWNNSYFRGAISGLGVANVWIALVEIFRLFNRK